MTGTRKDIGKAVAGKAVAGKAVTGKGPPAGSDDNLHKRIESERISAHIADFEKAGGRVEKLGVTQVLQKIAPPAAVIAPASKTAERPRTRKGS
jgi:hypothetical protein